MHRPKLLRNILAVPSLSVTKDGARGRLLVLAAAHRIDLLVGREAASLLLGKGKPPVDGNLEYPTDARHQFDFGAVFFD